MSKLPLVEFYCNGLPQVINLQGFKSAECKDATHDEYKSRDGTIIAKRVSHQIVLRWKHNLCLWYCWDNSPTMRDFLYQEILKKLKEMKS